MLMSTCILFIISLLYSVEFPVAKGAFKASKKSGNIAKVANPALVKAAKKRAAKLAKY